MRKEESQAVSRAAFYAKEWGISVESIKEDGDNLTVVVAPSTLWAQASRRCRIRAGMAMRHLAPKLRRLPMRSTIITTALLVAIVSLWGCAAGYSNERMAIYDRASAVETLINSNPCLAGDTAFCNKRGV